ncbi:Nucleolar protein 13 [Saxophila tyrrhenica]|uniref:Nucleolar protein 13 n=1 Tax=Saxophila tyrrhenica TaxID=1690608 RepID=A0AAV9P0C8_9PEZI|nr:Nucleolar protein 13 [Saxophila tyrrhenica]
MSEIIVKAEPVKMETTDSKRRRNETEDELEIDVNLPEPPSKRAKRREKKSSKKPNTAATNGTTATQASNDTPTAQQGHDDQSDLYPITSDTAAPQPIPEAGKRGEHGIWIGNLPFDANRDTIRTFLQEKGDISGEDIVRLHMPGPTKKSDRANEQHNRGFAYIDFTSEEINQRAIALSEKLVKGRKVLIKDAKNFEGRPAKAKDEDGTADGGSKKAPSKRVWIGNLGFDVTKEDIQELFAPAGEVEDVFLATFRDSGKCKGFGWVTFASLATSEAAVKGFFYRETLEEDKEASDNEGGVRVNTEARSKREKVWVNRLQGRPVKCEYAEDAQTRYKKRYGKDKDESKTANGGGKRRRDHDGVANGTDAAADELGRNERPAAQGQAFALTSTSQTKPKPKTKQTADERSNERRKRHDARMTAPGQALANTQRATGAIVAGSGKKTSFD